MSKLSGYSTSARETLNQFFSKLDFSQQATTPFGDYRSYLLENLISVKVTLLSKLSTIILLLLKPSFINNLILIFSSKI